jgi:hypothetical protein
MGEIADMMLDGTLCEGCGDFIGRHAGFPQYCSPRCAADRGLPYTPPTQRPRSSATAKKAARHNRERKLRAKAAGKPFECYCGKLCRTADGLKAHQQAKHGSGGWL